MLFPPAQSKRCSPRSATAAPPPRVTPSPPLGAPGATWSLATTRSATTWAPVSAQAQPTPSMWHPVRLWTRSTQVGHNSYNSYNSLLLLSLCFVPASQCHCWREQPLADQQTQNKCAVVANQTWAWLLLQCMHAVLLNSLLPPG